MPTVTGCFEWARLEFGAVDLGDWRLRRRLVETAGAIRFHPCGTLPEALPEWAALKGAYRLLDHERVSYDNVLRPHLERTRQACSEPGEYLLIEDTTALSYTHRGAGTVAGLGPITDQPQSQGLLLHSCVAARVEGWTPSREPQVVLVGLMGQRCWSRVQEQPKRQGKGKTRGGESDKWGRDLLEGDPVPGQASWTLVADREADIFELMSKSVAKGLGFVVRAAQPRRVQAQSGSVLDAAQQGKLLGRFDVALRARPGVQARVARVAVRVCTVTLLPPVDLRRAYEPLCVQVVYAAEENAPAGVAPLAWVLLTTWPCQTFAQACQVIGVYGGRWLVEEYHKVLKSGTHIEDSQLETAQRLQNLVAIHALAALDILKLKFLAQAHPDEPIPEDFVPTLWLRLLEARLGPQSSPWTYRSTLVAIARLGGFLARPRDGLPGWNTIWRGWQQLQWMALGYELTQN
jgi:hypothetical protein